MPSAIKPGQKQSKTNEMALFWSHNMYYMTKIPSCVCGRHGADAAGLNKLSIGDGTAALSAMYRVTIYRQSARSISPQIQYTYYFCMFCAGVQVGVWKYNKVFLVSYAAADSGHRSTAFKARLKHFAESDV